MKLERFEGRARVLTCAATVVFLVGCGGDIAENGSGAGAGNTTGAGAGNTTGTGAGNTTGTGAGNTTGTGAGNTTGTGAGNTTGTGAGGGTSTGTAGNGQGGDEPPPTLANCSVFPADNAWNTPVDNFPVRADSDTFIDSIGRFATAHPDFGTFWQGEPIGIPYVVVPGSQPGVPIVFTDYGDQSDPGPYPVPADAPIEGGPNAGGDRHVLVVDGDNCVLYEMFYSWPQNDGSWECSSGAIWDLKINATRPLTWTSADAAGLPILPGLVRYDEVVGKGVIEHALRFTVSQSQAAYVLPAGHYASNDTNPALPPMGLRVRMKAGYDCSAYSAEVQVVCTALKKYGMIVADNGTDWYISGAHDPAWNDDALADINDIPGDAFEVVDTGPIETY